MKTREQSTTRGWIIARVLDTGKSYQRLPDSDSPLNEDLWDGCEDPSRATVFDTAAEALTALAQRDNLEGGPRTHGWELIPVTVERTVEVVEVRSTTITPIARS